MTNITFKNGLPLLLQPAPGSDVGLVAADGGCCCPPPPPERCWCGSDCSYFIKVVEPLAVTARGDDCGGADTGNNILITPGLLQAIIPTYAGSAGFVYANSSQAYAGGMTASVTDGIAGFPAFLPPELYYFQLRASRSVLVEISCILEEEQPKYYVTISFSVNVVYVFDSLGFTTLGSWRRSYVGTFEIPSTCVVSPERECYPELLGSTEFRRINTPLEITLSGDGTSSLGSLTMIDEYGENGVPPDFPYAKDAVETIAEASSYTFRITARENCEPLPDPCTVLIDGVRVPVSDFDPFEVIAATWRGLSAPGSDKTFIDGVLFADNPSSVDSILNITTAGCDAGQINDVKAVYIATSGAGIVNECVTAESMPKYQTLVCEVVDENTARLYGGVATVKNYSPCAIGGIPSGDQVFEENQWSWECLLENGVPGAVTVSPSVGARYFNSEPVVCAVTHEPPVVTLDFVP